MDTLKKTNRVGSQNQFGAVKGLDEDAKDVDYQGLGSLDVQAVGVLQFNGCHHFSKPAFNPQCLFYEILFL